MNGCEIDFGNGTFNRKQNNMCNGLKNYHFNGPAGKRPISNEQVQIRTGWKNLRYRYV